MFSTRQAQLDIVDKRVRLLTEGESLLWTDLHAASQL
jgi:hypothetical protein